MPYPKYRPDFSSGISIGDYEVRTLTSNTTLNEDDDLVLLNASGGNFTVTLPSPSTSRSKRFFLKLVSASGSVVINPGSADIDGASSYTLSTQYDGISIMTNGNNWFIF